MASVDIIRLEFTYEADQDVLRAVRALVAEHGKKPVRADQTPDTVIMSPYVVPAVAYPGSSPYSFRLDLFGAGVEFPIQVNADGLSTLGRGAGWDAYVAEIEQRNRLLGITAASPLLPAVVPGTPTARMPSALVSVVRAFQPMRRSTEARLQKVTEHHAIVEMPAGKAPGGRVRVEPVVSVDLTVDGEHSLQAHLPLDQPSVMSRAVTGPADNLAALCLERIARLDTEAFKDLLALIDVAYTNQTRVLGINVRADHPDVPEDAARITWSELGRRRGWSRLDLNDRRERLGNSIDLLMSVQFTFELPNGARLSRAPLFYRAGILEQDGNRLGVVLGFNELLWKSMVKDRRAIIYDQAILTATPAQDWHFRIYQCLMWRLNQSWITQGLNAHHGRLELRLQSLLDRAVVDYEAQLQAKGPGWLRTRIHSVLDQLKAPVWDGRPLIAKYSIKPASNVLDDRIVIWPPADIVYQLNGHRTKALQARGGTSTKADTPGRKIPYAR